MANEEKAASKGSSSSSKAPQAEPLGPPTPEPVAVAPPKPQEALSPADIEFNPLISGGEIKVKVNSEVPTAQQVADAVGTQTGGAAPKLIITDGDGEETEVVLTPSDAATIVQRATVPHPVHAAAGHGSNPNLRDMTDEEREKDQAEYASRFG